jgi:hypothetical protein
VFDLAQIIAVQVIPPERRLRYGARLLAGRLPDPARGEDFIAPPKGPQTTGGDAPPPLRNIVVNASAVRALGFSGPGSAIGQIVLDGVKRRRIIGVVDDQTLAHSLIARPGPTSAASALEGCSCDVSDVFETRSTLARTAGRRHILDKRDARDNI